METILNLDKLKAGLSKTTMREQVSERLAAMVQSGLLQKGDELPSERELAATLEVSRETVRSAIQMLAAIGMVEISQGSRTRVVGTTGFPAGAQRMPGKTTQSAREVFEARYMLEIPAARLAVERIDAAGIARLRRLVEAQAEMTDDPVRFQISDAEFHDVIYAASGNPIVAKYLGEMFSFGMEFRRVVLSRKGSVATSLKDHRRILAGFEQRDANAVAIAIAEHHDRVSQSTIDVIASIKAETA